MDEHRVAPGLACAEGTLSPAQCYAQAALWRTHPQPRCRLAALDWERLADRLVARRASSR